MLTAFGNLRGAVVLILVVGSAALSLDATSLRGSGGALTASTARNATAATPPPCKCETWSSTWRRPNRTTPKCLFYDLGSGNGGAFNTFLASGFGSVANCPGGGAWEATLVEANPMFDMPLQLAATEHEAKRVHAKTSQAAYCCGAKAPFYLDLRNKGNPLVNFQGSSLSPLAADVMLSGLKRVDVPTLNLNRLLYEEAIQTDWVMVNMDVEGAEFDIVPCLADSPAAPLIDRLYLHQHDPLLGLAGTSAKEMQDSLVKLRTLGVDLQR